MPKWLASEDLPSNDQVNELVDIYFTRIHNVRCMGFLHIPSFMERLKRTVLDSCTPTHTFSGLIYIICALAAPFYYAKVVMGAAYASGNSDGDLDLADSGVWFFDAGKGWANVAAQVVSSSSSRTGTEALMTQILLHEYYLRTGDYAKGFLISGTIARHLQLLQLNIEHDCDVPCQRDKSFWAVRESRRRLVWACYLLDASIECGVDQLRFVSADDIHVQLPCSEDLFVRNIPCSTEMLTPGRLLPSVHQSQGPGAVHNLDLRSYYIRVMAVRSKILRYVKHLQGEIPWEKSENSRFYVLDGELRELEDSIPENLKMSSENTYVFKSFGRLSLYFGLHILFAQTFNDLYRIGVSKLVFPDSATKWIRENAPREFIQRCHHTCAKKAFHVGCLLRDLWHCHKPSLVDLPYLQHAQISSSVLVTSLASWTELEALLPQVSHRDYREILENNVNVLQYIQRYIKANMYYESAKQALKHFDKLFARETPRVRDENNVSSLEVGPTTIPKGDNTAQYSLEYILNPLGTYPMARKEVNDGERTQQTRPEDPGGTRPANVFNLELDAPDIPEADDLRHQNDTFLSHHSLDWGSEFTLMEGIGYPTFLEQFVQENSNPEYQNWPFE